ncbi:MAG TPA: hypothetical protein VN794_20265, partial [Methylomirabilota bacterium]|nr:hypothetical protein [Methylomirabilota bacterium]
SESSKHQAPTSREIRTPREIREFVIRHSLFEFPSLFELRLFRFSDFTHPSAPSSWKKRPPKAGVVPISGRLVNGSLLGKKNVL